MATDIYRSDSGKQVGYVIKSSGDIYQSGKATKVGYGVYDGIGERGSIRQVGGAALLLILME
jgi:hypothetical protein